MSCKLRVRYQLWDFSPEANCALNSPNFFLGIVSVRCQVFYTVRPSRNGIHAQRYGPLGYFGHILSANPSPVLIQKEPSCHSDCMRWVS